MRAIDLREPNRLSNSPVVGGPALQQRRLGTARVVEVQTANKCTGALSTSCLRSIDLVGSALRG